MEPHQIIKEIHINYLVVETAEDDKGSKPSGSEGVEGLEEEDKLEVLRNLLEFWTKRGDGDKLGDVEDDRKDDHWHDVPQGQHFVCLFTGLLLRTNI